MRSTSTTLSSLLVGAVMLLLPVAGMAEDTNALGKQLYGKYCSACHGPGGKGDGVVSQLMTVKPTDLTLLAKKGNGKLDLHDLVRVIDGRETVRAHGDSDMPVWGEVFTAEEGDAPDRHAVARGKVILIADFIESIQAK